MREREDGTGTLSVSSVVNFGVASTKFSPDDEGKVGKIEENLCELKFLILHDISFFPSAQSCFRVVCIRIKLPLKQIGSTLYLPSCSTFGGEKEVGPGV